MSAFTGPLTLTHIDAADYLWRLDSDLSWELDSLGSGRFVTVKPGFVTDGATVPRILWAIWPAWGRYSRSAVVHDLLCWSIDTGKPLDAAPNMRAAALIFKDMLAAEGVSCVSRFFLFAGVFFWACLRDIAHLKASSAGVGIPATAAS